MQLTTKFFPINIYDTHAAESYLAQMAQKGFLLKKLSFFAQYEQAPPQTLRFCLVPLTQKQQQPTPQQHQQFAASGWHFVCTAGHSFFVLSTSSEQAHRAEILPHQPEQKAAVCAHLQNRIKLSLLTVLLLLLPELCMTFFMARFKLTPLLFAIQYGHINYQLLLLALALFFLFQVHQKNRLLKQLLIWLPHEPPLSEAKHREIPLAYPLFLCSILLFALLAVTSSLFQISSVLSATPQPISHQAAPPISLYTVEKAAGPGASLVQPDDFSAGTVAKSWSGLAPVKIFSHESAQIPQLQWRDSHESYTPSLTTQYYELAFSGLSKRLVKELLVQQVRQLRFEQVTLKELLNTPFDRAFLVESGRTQMLFACYKQKVVFLKYEGYSDLSRITLDVVSALLLHSAS